MEREKGNIQRIITKGEREEGITEMFGSEEEWLDTPQKLQPASYLTLSWLSLPYSQPTTLLP